MCRRSHKRTFPHIKTVLNLPEKSFYFLNSQNILQALLSSWFIFKFITFKIKIPPFLNSLSLKRTEVELKQIKRFFFY